MSLNFFWYKKIEWHDVNAYYHHDSWKIILFYLILLFVDEYKYYRVINI